MARIGKIARLPLALREELNRRLQAGQLGPDILPWINSHPEAVQVLSARFGGKPINAQNLSDWRQGGYQDWLRKQDRTHRIKELAAFAADLAKANDSSIAAGAAAIAAGKILELLEAAEAAADHKQHDPAELAELIRGLTSLRSTEIAQQRANLDAERLKRKDEELALAKAAFQQRLKEYQEKVAAQKRRIEGALSDAKAGGITPETLAKIEEAARLL